MVGNMAATIAEESPKPPTSPSEDVETLGQTNESTESEGAVHNAGGTSSSKARVNSGDTQGETLARDGVICASHSRVSVEPGGAGTNQATRKSSDEQKPVENMKDTSADEQRALDSCEMEEEDDEEIKTPGQETGRRMCFYVLHH